MLASYTPTEDPQEPSQTARPDLPVQPVRDVQGERASPALLDHQQEMELEMPTVDMMLDADEELLHLPVVQRRRHASSNGHKENQTLSQPATYDLTVVIPTRNERDNIMPLLHALREALDAMRVEIIFVDDSDDDTQLIIKDASVAMETSMFHVHLEHRQPGIARAGGLATAVVHGMDRAQAEYVAVIDADLQHPPEQLRVFYDQAVAQNADLVLASRYIKGGSYRGLAGVGRRFISVGLKWTAKLLFPEHLLRISDPLGGFFLLRRSLLADVSLRPIGYKILLEILIRCQWRQVLEVPYHFRTRAHGQSKANMQQGLLALQHMQRLWREVPAAGRVWKISILILLNVLITLALFNVNKSFPWVWANLNMVVFGVMACLDFILFNRFILPAPIVTSSVAPSAASLTSIEDIETVELPSPQKGSTNGHHLSSIDDVETVELPSPRNAITNGHHLSPIDDIETVELPSPRNAITNGHHLSPIDDIETVELPSPQKGSTNGHHLSSIDDVETVELPSPRNAITNGHHLSPIDDIETVELPSPRNAITNGHHLSPIDDIETVELPSTELVVASASDLIQKFQPTRKKNFYDKFPSVAAVAVVILAAGWVSYALPGALLVLAVLFIGSAIAFTKNVDRDQAITMVLAIAVGVAIIDYLSWRFAATNWHGWWISVPLLFAEVLGALHVLGFQFTIWPWPPPEIEQSEDPTQHPIFVFIPTVNEGVAILRPTLEGIIAARDKYLAQYPHGRVTIVVCNDGRVAKVANWEEIDNLAQELGVCCVTRTKGGGAKAGNIENARQELQATGDALLVIFDADQIAKPDFLLKTIPPFRDPKMGWVQTGQYYANLDNPVTRWADDQQSMFYNLLCPGKAALNAAFICGTNVVIRAAALDEIGGLPQDSVTEDFAASIALHPSWRSIYLTDVLATGLGPLDMPSFLKQQGRWALGTLGVFRTHWREIFLPKKHGLHIGQRVQYLLACTHYLCGLRDLIYLLSPMLFIFTGIPAVRSTYLSDYLWHFLPYALLSAAALWYSARGVTGLRGIIIGFGSFPVLIGSLLSVVLQRKVGFAVTSKQRGGKRSLSYLGVYIFFMLLCVACLFWATQVKGQEQTSLFISVLWVVYSLLMLGSFLWLNFKDMRFQAAVQRSGATDETLADRPYPSKLLQRQRGLNPVWNLGLAALLAGPILASNALGSLAIFASGQSTPFVISQEKIAAPYFGVSLPI